MANILHYTEQFENAYWTPNDPSTVVTPDTSPPPYTGTGGSPADTVADTSAVVQCLLAGTFEDIVADTSDWLCSIFVQKDADNTVFPVFFLQLAGGTGIITGLNINTSDGSLAGVGTVVPDASGVVDVNASWWRFWWRIANNGGNNSARLFFYPALTNSLGGSGDGALMRSMIVWGANLTNTSVLQPYQPNPPYQFNLIRP